MRGRKPSGIRTHHVRIRVEDFEELAQRRDAIGYKNIHSVIHALIKQSDKPPTIEEVMKETTPVVIVGLPNHGKTHFIRNKLIPALSNKHDRVSVLVIDRGNEYDSLENVGKSVHAIDWKKPNQRLRIVPSDDPEVAKTEVDLTIRNLVTHAYAGNMKNWILIIEECQLYQDLGSLRDFVYRSRRFLRKLILVTPKLDAFPGLQTFRIHWEKSD